MPSAQDAIYSSTGYHQLKHGASLQASDLITRYRTEKFTALMGGADLDVLEVGVGPGWNLVQLPARRRVGQDVTLEYADHLRQEGIEFVSALAQLSGQQFHVVIVSHVLEHLLEPARMLAEILPLLKPDGKLLVLVPLEASVRKYSVSDKNHHLFSWSAHTLHEFLTANGYMVRSCSVKRHGYDRFAAELSVRVRGGLGVYKFLLWLLRTIRPCHEIQAVASYKTQAL
jgi:2-polyprenyl-3-methyl-5-hydroxy-6-metoxy-1,4-benzoquinol methylase